MASTYSGLKIELIGLGEQVGTWGTTTNTNLGTTIEQAIVGKATVNFSTDANKTLNFTNTNAAQDARALFLNATSGVSLTATRDLIVPSINKTYIVKNSTTGGQSIRVIAAGAGVTIPNGKTAILYNDATDVTFQFDYAGALSLASTLSVTGAITATGGVVGNLTGNVTGHLTGNVTGDVTGNAGTVTNGVYTTGTQSIGGVKTFTGTSVVVNGVSGSYTGQFYLGSRYIRNVTATDLWEMVNAAGTTTIFSFENDGDFIAAGNVTAYSDINLKTDLKRIGDALNKVKKLTGYTYTRTDSGERHTGLVAQEVEEVLPEAVKQGQHLSLAYGNMVGLLVEAIKELSDRIEKLEAK
jgi:hypothetical protein